MRTSLRAVTQMPFIPMPTADDQKINCSISQKFQTAIQKQDVDLAFQYWSQEFERVLQTLGRVHAQMPYSKVAAKRGQILFHEQRLFPKTVKQRACTLNNRQLWKAHCRLHEILVASPGFRRDKTIQNLNAVHPYLSSENVRLFAAAVQNCLVDNAIAQGSRQDKQQRILEWKRRTRKDEKAFYQYIRRKSTALPVKVSLANGSLTADVSARLESIVAVWKDICSRHKDGEPTFRNFMEKYGQTLSTHSTVLPVISADLLSGTLNNMKLSSPGLDQINTEELKLVVAWCPDMLTNLSTLLQTVELCHKWPQNLVKGAVTFIPKDAENASPTASDFRPITILSIVYRLWSAARHTQLAEHWYPHWKHANSFGGKFSKAADQLAFDTCLQVEAALAENKFVAGISFDLAKCFDTVPYNLALDILAARGADLAVVQTLRAFL